MALSEAELVSKIETFLKQKFSTELTFREISAGYGIADLVFAPSESSFVVEREPITHFATLQLFLKIGRKKYRPDELQALVPFMPKTDLRKSINFLLRNEYLSVDSNGLYKKIHVVSKNDPIKKIIAIEAKLTDYRNGIIQAKRYQYFADQSYLAILKAAAKHIDIEALRDSGIGLILFDEVTETVKIYRPRKPSVSMQDNIYRTFAREQMLNKLASVS